MKGGKIRVTLPDSMSDEEKIKSIENMKGIIKIFEEIAGGEGTTDFSDADQKIAELKKAELKKAEPQADGGGKNGREI